MNHAKTFESITHNKRIESFIDPQNLSAGRETTKAKATKINKHGW